MFFVLSKLLSFAFSPLVWVFGLLLFGLILGKRKSYRKYLILSLLLFYFFSNQFISEGIIGWWEVSSLSNKQQQHYPIGVVLSGGLVAYDEENNRLIYGQSADRILQAVDQYQAKRIDKILISGGTGSLIDNDFVESVLMKKFLVNIGIPAEDVWVDSTSRNTHENATESMKIIEEQYPEGRFLLFTSALHMRRAQACFNKQSANFDVYSTNEIIRNRNQTLGYYILPSSLAIYQWESMIHEMIGTLVYKFLGYI